MTPTTAPAGRSARLQRGSVGAAALARGLGPAAPSDVRLMNWVSALVGFAVGVALLAAGVLWLTRSPWFTISGIVIEGELTRNTEATLRANAMPRLAGNFFSADLQAARQAFESVPWVRHAVVRRIWPNQLAVVLEEHRPAALWQGDERGERLVNTFGEVFDANLGDVEEDELPIFEGPEGSAAQMLAMLRALNPLLQGWPGGATRISSMELSARSSWSVMLDNGATLELGRGTPAEVLARTKRFLATLPQLLERWPGSPVERADLRHAEGYALKLRGMTVGATTSPKPGTNTPGAAPAAAPKTN